MTVFARIGVRGAALAVLAGVIVLLARGGLVPFVGLAHAEDAPARPAMPAATVTSFVATLEPWVSRIEVTGSVRAERQIELAPEEPGTVAAVRFDSGQDVASGALLVQLDDSVDRAEVTRLEAERALARTTLDREERLARTDATSHAALDQAREAAAGNDGMMLCLAVNYGARPEITEAVQQICRRIAAGEMSPEEISEQTVADHLMTAGMPAPDLVIRTAGEMRISNFLLWQISYAELWVTDCHWPDFREPHLHQALRDFASRDRRFGGLNNDVAAASPVRASSSDVQ